jgi:5'(3')-deoxyribonucleotidase
MANFYPPGFEHEKKNIAIDFDGVIHNADKGWGDGTCYGDPLPGALEALKILSGKYKIIIFTAKAKSDRPLVNGKTGAMLVTEWLEKHQVLQYVHTVTSDKPRADLYIDDNGYRFENWNNTLKFVESYEKL